MTWHRLARRSGALVTLAIALAGCGAAPEPPAPTLPAEATRPAAQLDIATPRPSAAPAAAAATPAPTLPAPPAPATPEATAAASAPPATAAPAESAPTLAAAPAPELKRALQLTDPPMRGDDVRAAQRRLRDLGYVGVGAADGIFGRNTQAAVRAFQTLNELAADGVVGPQTWAKLFGAGVAPRVDPIVDADNGWLLGGARGDTWLDGPTTAALLGGGETYTLYSRAGAAGTSAGSLLAPEPGPCEDLVRVKLDPPATITGTIALAGSWNPTPRAPVEEPISAPEYTRAVADLLRANGIASPEVRLTRVLRVDLEGDGVEETLIAATRYVEGDAFPSPNAAAGDYSLVVVSRTVNGRQVMLPIAAEYYPAAKEFNAPSRHELVAALDLNGDGRMEVVVNSAYYEGAATVAYTVVGDQIASPVGAACGV